jgi:hypothetical protein
MVIPLWVPILRARSAVTTELTIADRAGNHPPGAPGLAARARNIPVLCGQVLLSWLSAVPRRPGDRLFAMNDAEACWRRWQIAKTRGGLAQSYRDPRFDTLAECARCRGTGTDRAGVSTDVPCVPCLGTGRITLGKVS